MGKPGLTEAEAAARLPDMVRRFAALLADPQPGLIMWNVMREQLAQELYDTLAVWLRGE